MSKRPGFWRKLAVRSPQPAEAVEKPPGWVLTVNFEPGDDVRALYEGAKIIVHHGQPPIVELPDGRQFEMQPA